ncbi:MAG: TAXI family TRAP transporter solute-binding subunit [Lachnospiraceae bacterium]|nr:TAXI family TRAP transporter solute-binding subunit [Lachnospiraceae bacterium]
MRGFKRALSLLVVLLMTISVVACGGSSSSSGSKKITLASGGTSGTYYGFSGVIAQRLNETLSDKLKINVVSTGASKVNVQMVDDGDADIAILQNDVMSYAYNATDMFEGSEPITSFSAIASCYPESIQIVANKSITNISDLRGKRVSVGDAGSGTEFNAKQILEVYDIDMENDITKSNQSFADSCDALKNGTIDAAFVTAGHPTVAVTELASNYDFNILPLDTNHINSLIEKYGFYAPVTIEKDSYSVLNDDVQSVAVMATFIASNKLDEDTVYAFTKGLFEEKSNFEHQKAALLNLETGVSGIAIPFHKGAAKYYSENGISVE